MATQSSVNISLPRIMRDWVEQQVASSGYGTTSEYFRALVREDQKRQMATRWDQELFVLVAYRLLAPGSEWRLHREWFGRTALKIGTLRPTSSHSA